MSNVGSRPADAWCGRLDGEHLTGAWLGEHTCRTVPLGRDHEQQAPIAASERTGEAAAVKRDRLHHLTAFANAHAPFVGDVRVPDGTMRVEANTVWYAVAQIGPDPATRQAAVRGDVEGREPFRVGLGNDQ